MEDQVCLLTDGCSVDGRALAVSLAKMDATVVFAAPSAEVGSAARAEIAQRSGSRRVGVLAADLSSRDGVLELAADFLCAHDRLDVLVNNAQIRAGQRELTVDGYESTFAINHLARFQLTRLLLDHRKSAEPMRVVNVVGDQARTLELPNLNGDHRFSPGEAARAASLAGVLFSYELARRTEGTLVTVNCAHAGATWLASARRRTVGPLFLATSPLVADVSGQYFAGMKEARSTPASYDAGLAARLWALSDKYVAQDGAPAREVSKASFFAQPAQPILGA